MASAAVSSASRARQGRRSSAESFWVAFALSVVAVVAFVALVAWAGPFHSALTLLALAVLAAGLTAAAAFWWSGAWAAAGAGTAWSVAILLAFLAVSWVLSTVGESPW